MLMNDKNFLSVKTYLLIALQAQQKSCFSLQLPEDVYIFYLYVLQKYKDNIHSDAYFPEQHHNAIK